MSDLPLNTKRRFIAGAVCPRCNEMDTIVMFRRDGREHRECVSCDFREQARFDQPQKELPTRVNRPDPEPEADIQVVRILDPEPAK
ncbi:YheV family putative zinc ribbon protein [Gilvimarinus sp. F26214L]|uniref:YheV family putative zinc ribbon protein n=1 Tax=Gilvimarinus sp. DZF01 TaxID=3461371 RepID=UPI004045EAB2